MSTSDAPQSVPAGAGPLSLHLDERERSATVTLQRPGLPDDAPDEWREQGFNAHVTSTTYRAIDDVAITGWTHVPLTHWTIEAHPDPRRVTVTLSGEDQQVTFSADSDVRTTRRGLRTGSF
jgi:hypothetical protein